MTDLPVTGQMRQQSGASPVLLLCCHTLSFFVPMRAPVRRSPCIPPPQSHWQHPPTQRVSSETPAHHNSLPQRLLPDGRAPAPGGWGWGGNVPSVLVTWLILIHTRKESGPSPSGKACQKEHSSGGMWSPPPQQNATQEHPGSPGSCDSDSVTCTFAWLGPQNVSHMLAEAWCLLGLPFH